jgi:dihydroneopterin aldolase
VSPVGHCSISLEGIEVFAHHGVLPEEKERGQRFLIDVLMELTAAPEGDELSATVDYSEVASRVASICTGETFDLIETLAAKLADELLSYEQVSSATVTVHKPDAPMPVKTGGVSVTVSRQRQGTRGYFEGGDE